MAEYELTEENINDAAAQLMEINKRHSRGERIEYVNSSGQSEMPVTAPNR